MGKRGGLGFQESDAFKRKKRKEEKGRFGRRLFLEGIRDYLLSDSYMYAPLLSPAPPSLDLTVKKTPLSTRGYPHGTQGNQTFGAEIEAPLHFSTIEQGEECW